MRWKDKPEPETGAKRLVSKFLFAEKKIGKETRWMEWATWEEEYTRWKDSYLSLNFGWTCSRWAEPRLEYPGDVPPPAPPPPLEYGTRND